MGMNAQRMTPSVPCRDCDWMSDHDVIWHMNMDGVWPEERPRPSVLSAIHL